ncbi:hypothetical protein V8E53_002164 [Lactarius tabidus]
MSFISVEPQSRDLLKVHSDSLLAQFDTQLQIIAERYLAFFQERRRIETTYIDSLRNLYRKAKAVDASYDPRAEPTTTRSAWDEVTDNLEREANTQKSFVDILDNDVIKPLITLKETNDEIRRQIERDLKSSAAKYADHAENTISKLQQAYLRRYPQQYAHSTDVIPNKRFGNKVSSLFRRSQPQEPAKSEDGIAHINHGFQLGLLKWPSELVYFDNDCRKAVGQLSDFRWIRADHLGDGYDCLEELVYTPTVKNALVKYTDGIITTCAQYANLATSTRAEVEKSLTGRDTSGLKASFRRALSHSIPPLSLYRNYHLGANSRLIFGVPLVGLEIDQDNVPKVMRMCIEGVEKRGLNVRGIYSVDFTVHQVVEASTSTPTPNLLADVNSHSDATEARKRKVIFVQHYRWYLLRCDDSQASYTATNLSLLRSKIRDLHPVQRASLGALLQHLLRVASHSEKNKMSVTTLATSFSDLIFRDNAVGKLVLEDLVQNAHTLFDERPSESSSPPAEVQTMGASTQNRPAFVGTFSTSSRSSLLSDATAESRLAPSPTTRSSLIRKGFPSSKTLTEGVDATTQEQVIPEARGTESGETLANSTLPEAVSVPPTSVDEWRLHSDVAMRRLRELPPNVLIGLFATDLLRLFLKIMRGARVNEVANMSLTRNNLDYYMRLLAEGDLGKQGENGPGSSVEIDNFETGGPLARPDLGFSRKDESIDECRRLRASPLLALQPLDGAVTTIPPPLSFAS